MKRVAAIASVSILLLGAGRARAAANVGDTAPEISAGYWLNTQPLSLEALRGRIVIVEFWATWCPPCRATIPHLVDLHKTYKDKGVVIVSLTDEPRGKVEGFAKQMGMVYPVGGDSKTGDVYGVRGIPHAVLVDPSGKIVWRGHPAGGLDRVLEEQMGKTPPSLVHPKEKAAALDAVAKVEGAVEKQQWSEAIALLAKVPDLDEGEVKQRTQAVRKAIEAAAEEQLKRAEVHLDAKRHLEASEALTEVAQQFPGTGPAREAEARLAELMADPEIRTAIEKAHREKRATALLAAIKRQESVKPSATVLRALEHLAATYPGTEAGKEAAVRAEAMRNDKELMARIRAEKAERDCRGWLSMARNFIKAGMPEKARTYLEKVIENYGDTPYASEARAMLKEMDRR